MQLWLTPDLAQQLAVHARTSQPDECCGVLIGKGSQITQIVPIPNIAEKPQTSYRMDDRSLSEILFRADNGQESVIGFYHSHPRTDPIPSQSDIQQAHYSEMAYVIIGMRSSQPEVAAWSFQRDRVARITVFVSSERPNSEPAPLSLTHKRAIIIAACIAFAFMIIVSLSLLPPAPIIPGH